MNSQWEILSRFYTNFGPKKVEFLNFGAKFFTYFLIFAPKKAQEFNFLNFKTRENLFLRQIFCEFIMSQKLSIFPTVHSDDALNLHWLRSNEELDLEFDEEAKTLLDGFILITKNSERISPS